jgi:hypothetical protein
MAWFRKCAKRLRERPEGHKRKETTQGKQMKYRRKEPSSCTVCWYSTSWNTTISEGYAVSAGGVGAFEYLVQTVRTSRVHPCGLRSWGNVGEMGGRIRGTATRRTSSLATLPWNVPGNSRATTGGSSVQWKGEGSILKFWQNWPEFPFPWRIHP